MAPCWASTAPSMPQRQVKKAIMKTEIKAEVTGCVAVIDAGYPLTSSSWLPAGLRSLAPAPDTLLTRQVPEIMQVSAPSNAPSDVRANASRPPSPLRRLRGGPEQPRAASGRHAGEAPGEALPTSCRAPGAARSGGHPRRAAAAPLARGHLRGLRERAQHGGATPSYGPPPTGPRPPDHR